MLQYGDGTFYSYLKENEDLEELLSNLGIDRVIDCTIDGEVFKVDGYRIAVQWWKFTEYSKYRWRVVISH